MRLYFIEFNYMCLQAYDFVELKSRHNCHLQMGGSDQWGNIVTGLDLGRRMGTPQLYALTSPLLTTAPAPRWARPPPARSGSTPTCCRSMITGNIGATPRTPTCRGFSSSSPPCRWTRSQKLAALQGSEINEAKKILANEATALLHGRAAAEQAAETARKTLRKACWRRACRPSRSLGEIAAGLGVLAAFVKAGLTPSTGEARRQIKGGGLKGQRRDDHRRALVLGEADFAKEGVAKLSVGKKKHILLKPE